METDPYELDAVQKMQIEWIAKTHGMTIRQAVTYVMSIGMYADDQFIQGREVTIGKWDAPDIRGLIDTIKLMGVDKG